MVGVRVLSLALPRFLLLFSLLPTLSFPLLVHLQWPPLYVTTIPPPLHWCSILYPFLPRLSLHHMRFCPGGGLQSPSPADHCVAPQSCVLYLSLSLSVTFSLSQASEVWGFRCWGHGYVGSDPNNAPTLFIFFFLVVYSKYLTNPMNSTSQNPVQLATLV